MPIRSCRWTGAGSMRPVAPLLSAQPYHGALSPTAGSMEAAPVPSARPSRSSVRPAKTGGRRSSQMAATGSRLAPTRKRALHASWHTRRKARARARFHRRHCALLAPDASRCKLTSLRIAPLPRPSRSAKRSGSTKRSSSKNTKLEGDSLSHIGRRAERCRHANSTRQMRGYRLLRNGASASRHRTRRRRKSYRLERAARGAGRAPRLAALLAVRTGQNPSRDGSWAKDLEARPLAIGAIGENGCPSALGFRPPSALLHGRIGIRSSNPWLDNGLAFHNGLAVFFGHT
mmetsp:Transcript_12246/g.28336  ORF Transcript_12246/g.28336 Transcript_12246/m.28336 type:complete len:288 (+) Transcript_12246:310-1173(+)